MDLFDLVKQAETETDAGKLERVFQDSIKRINAAELTDGQRTRILKDANERHIIGQAAADILRRIPAAAGKVYDINSKAAMIGGEIVRGSNWTRAHRDATGWRAYISTASYSDREEISFYVTGSNYSRTARVYLTETDGKKRRIDADKTAAAVLSLLKSVTEEIADLADLAENVKNYEEKKAAVIRLIEEIRGTAGKSYDTARALGLYPDSYKPFYSASVH